MAATHRFRIPPLPLPSGRRLKWRWVILAAVGLPLAALAFPPTRGIASAGIGRALMAVTSPFAPDISGFQDLAATTKIVAADGSVLAQIDGTQSLDKVRLADLPPVVPHAVLAAEDAGFYREGAVDPAGMLRAVWADVGGSSYQGGSTITQQLAKINYVGSERTVVRKVEEVLYADELTRRYTKQQLLQRYLNQVYFGDGAYGIAAAARTYFGESAGQLTAPQAALLAGKIRSPEGLNPVTRPAAVTTRRNQVLRAMAAHHWLPAGELAGDLASPLGVTVHRAPGDPGPAPRFVDYVRREATTLPVLGASPDARQRALATGGYTVYTTLQPAAERAAEDATRASLGAPGDPTAAAVSVQPGDGAIRVLFGGLDYGHTPFDPATDGYRQPGSAFKPFVYLAALQAGIDPRSVLPADSPMTVTYRGAPYAVHNYEPGEPRASIDEALARSINTVFAQVVAAVGPDKVVQMAEAAGLPPTLDADAQNPSVALGALTKGVSPLQMATAYATIAARGTYAAPYAIARIVDRHGREVFRHAPDTRPALDPKLVAVLTRAMEGVVDHGTGTAAAIGRPVAGKTGTTENFGDAWFIGFTPQLTTAVWVGHLEGRVPMTDVHGVDVTGGTYPAQIFATIMKAALADRPVENLVSAGPESLSLHPFGQVPGQTPPPSLPAPGLPAPTFRSGPVAPAGPAPTTPSSSTTTSGPTPTTAYPTTTAPAPSTTTTTGYPGGTTTTAAGG